MVFEFVAVKKFGKELGNDGHHITGPRVEFIRQNHNEGIYSVRFKYVVCSPTKVVLNLTELQRPQFEVIPFSCGEKIIRRTSPS